jgi:glycosyltransferase involved in cell wall biosynthesis
MKIAMFTNTYLPHVGGVARSVSTYEEAFCQRGHEVRVVAPQFEGADDSSGRVLRTPAIQKFNGSDFSYRIPVPGLLSDFVDQFRPNVLHSHHPFLLGDSALRLAWARKLPLVFTYHTMYEQYTHYVPIDSDAIKRFAIQMATDYCNLCTHVIAPSESVAALIQDRGVTTPVTAIPTGIDVEFFARGNREQGRRRFSCRPDEIVVGHVGRLAAEKNLDYLAQAMRLYLADHPDSTFLVVGAGESAGSIKRSLRQAEEAGQLVMPGCLTGQQLADAYAAMDVFTFSSQSETQGMVLAEAMAAGATAVALDAPGAREIVVDTVNGRLLSKDAPEQKFAQALAEITDDENRLREYRAAAKRTAESFSIDNCANRVLAVYEELLRDHAQGREGDPGPWDRLLGRLDIEWNLLREKTAAFVAAAREDDPTKARLQ